MRCPICHMDGKEVGTYSDGYVEYYCEGCGIYFTEKMPDDRRFFE